MFDQHDGATPKQPMFILRADRNAEFHGSWVRLPQVDTDPTGFIEPNDLGAVWYHKGMKEIRYWAGTVAGVKRVATV